MDSLEIQNPNHLLLLPREEEIFKRMFAGYEQVIIEVELKGGFTQSRVFIARPFKQKDRSELRTVVKCAPAYLIQKEEQAYQTYIQNRLPNASELHQSIYINDWAGLRYQLEGEGIFSVESLFAYLCRSEVDLDDIIEHTLKRRLFRSIGQLWRKVERTQEGFPIRGSYDPLLPVNLVVSTCDEDGLSAGATLHHLTPDTVTGQTVKSGDYVCLEGFEITEVDPYEAEPRSNEVTEVTLNCPPNSDGVPNSYRLRLTLTSQQDLADYQIGQVLPKPVVGQVSTTRIEQLHHLIHQTLGNPVDLALERIPLTRPGKIIPQPVHLPNPLLKLPQILQHSLDVYISQAIHGDLNLENVLVDPDTGNIYLIDFADARRDHRLHDLLRLETGIITRLLPLVLNQANLAAANLLPEVIYNLHEQLHRATFQLPPTQPKLLSPILEKPFAILAAIRQEAYFYLYSPETPAEYYHPLTIYLLGAMKFKNLDRQAKRVAFWSAGAAQQLLEDTASSRERKKPPGASRFERPKTDTMFWPKDGKEMVRIPAGKFVYGGAKVFTPLPNSTRTLPEFWIDKTPVTNAEYYRFVSETGYKSPVHWQNFHTVDEIADHPVTGVSWEDVNSYAKWANKRLPTEQEWEKAARGTDGRAYPWGNHSPTPELCNFDQNEEGTTPVGKYSPQGDSPYGCSDMVGNVWEWTLSSEDLFILKVKTFRGGSWYTSRRYLHAAHRNFTVVKTRPDIVGFRCVVVLKE